jgi:AcrR family transcriptional regulator
VSGDLRSKILELAIAVIDEQGEQAIRTNKLAIDAGTTPPTLYHYFNNREGLVEEAQVERFVRSISIDIELLVDHLKKAKTKEDLLGGINDLFKRRDSAERTILRSRRMNAVGATFARPSLANRIAEAHNELCTRAALALAPFQRQGIIRQDIDLRAVVARYNGAVLGKALAGLPGSDIDQEQWERTMNEAVLYVLFGRND